MKEYSRGSEWRRWDLHIHTASSYDAYKGDDSDKLLADAINKNELAAIAITDHFIIDKDRIANIRGLVPSTTVFPGVELRTDKGDTNIHVILIFSDQIDLKTLSEDFNVFRREAKNPNDNDKIYWDYKDICTFAQKHNALISIHAGSKDKGVDTQISNALPINQAVKEEFAESVSIFEVGKEKDIANYKEHVFPDIKSIKPLIICSDSHDPRNYNPAHQLWIKSDPTFNGLKQIIYEPEERVVNVMSPGKKALVLLQLLIDLDETDCPILIDQPEDDLDNRSIFEQLIPFIKKKKAVRQIIVVTHNANIVVGADAEEVIIANQNGADSPNKDSIHFSYRSGSIENDGPLLKEAGVVEDGILAKQGIQQHICDILEGGEKAFEKRKNKYNLNS